MTGFSWVGYVTSHATWNPIESKLPQVDNPASPIRVSLRSQPSKDRRHQKLDSDAWLQPDKGLHFLFCFAVTLCAYWTAKLSRKLIRYRFPFAIACSLCLAFGKELGDFLGVRISAGYPFSIHPKTICCSWQPNCNVFARTSLCP